MVSINKKLRVLVVEDELDLLETIALIVESLFDEVEVLTADGGYRAQQILNENKQFDLIITDIRMPQGTGVELIGFCKRKQLNIPIIVYHGSPSYLADLEHATKDCVAIVQKPYVKKLKTAIFEAVNGPRTYSAIP